MRGQGGTYPGAVQEQRLEAGPILVRWADSTHHPALAPEVLAPLGEQQARRFRSLHGTRARRFLVGRRLLIDAIGEFTDLADVGFTTTCERCGAEHGRPRLEHAPVVVSVSYAGSMVAVAAAGLNDALAVGVDIEQLPSGDRSVALEDLAPLFAPNPPPDMQRWTLLEAALKADGRGVRVDPARVGVGGIGSGEVRGWRALRITGRAEGVDATAIEGPAGFALSAAMVRASR